MTFQTWRKSLWRSLLTQFQHWSQTSLAQIETAPNEQPEEHLKAIAPHSSNVLTWQHPTHLVKNPAPHNATIPAAWLERVTTGPPAHWLEKVQAGAPDLLQTASNLSSPDYPTPQAPTVSTSQPRPLAFQLKPASAQSSAQPSAQPPARPSSSTQITHTQPPQLTLRPLHPSHPNPPSSTPFTAPANNSANKAGDSPSQRNHQQLHPLISLSPPDQQPSIHPTANPTTHPNVSKPLVFTATDSQQTSPTTQPTAASFPTAQAPPTPLSNQTQPSPSPLNQHQHPPYNTHTNSLSALPQSPTLVRSPPSTAPIPLLLSTNPPSTHPHNNTPAPPSPIPYPLQSQHHTVHRQQSVFPHPSSPWPALPSPLPTLPPFSTNPQHLTRLEQEQQGKPWNELRF